METIAKAVNDFVGRMTTLVEAQIKEQVIDRMKESNGHSRGRAPAAVKAKTARRKGPIQLCPAPGCKERSAPVFSMMCKKHKDASKTQIKKWREARRRKTGK